MQWKHGWWRKIPRIIKIINVGTSQVCNAGVMLDKTKTTIPVIEF
jgi:hypothetical protein